MQKIHFSLTAHALVWLQQQAKAAGMNRSAYLNHLLLKLIEAESKQ